MSEYDEYGHYPPDHSYPYGNIDYTHTGHENSSDYGHGYLGEEQLPFKALVWPWFALILCILTGVLSAANNGIARVY
jgi:hypothetical protein